MHATEVLRRYAAGERDFRGANLRGQNLKGQNLSGADFSHADIRGANFTNANLQTANFTGAKAGVQRRWLLIQWVVSFSLSVLLNFVAAILNGGFIGYLFSEESTKDTGYLPGIFALLIVATVFFAIARQGLTMKALVAIAFAFAFSFAFAFAGVVVSAGSGAGAIAFAFAIASVFAVAISIAIAVTGVVAVSFAFAIASVFAVAFAGAIVFAHADAFDDTISIAVAEAVAVAVALLSGYVAWRALKGDPKFALILTLGIAFAAIGGTRFYKADLTGADFSNTILKSSNFNAATLTHTCWKDAKQLDRARVSESILTNLQVQRLLITRNGYKQSYLGANLEGANLNGVDLSEANLTRANLSGATLERAELKHANLKEILATGTDFSGAHLTGACLEAWNIDDTTVLDGVDCQYVFLLEQPDAKGSRERRPHDPDLIFALGDFEKLYTKMRNVVQILLRNGINREAFAAAFQKLTEENPAITYDSIQAMEKKGTDVLLTLEVPETADKAAVSQSFLQPYEERVQQLEAKNEQLQLHAADLKDIALALASKPIINQAVGQGTTMQETNDSSRKIEIGNIGRDFHASGQALNLGDLSGQITNTIAQLPDQPASADQPSLKQLLTQLQRVIEADTDLSDADKADLLEQVQGLATAQQTEEPAQKDGMVRKAKKMFEATLKGLPDTAKIVEACSKLLPMILKTLGFPA